MKLSENNEAVFGIYQSRQNLERGVEMLKSSGYDSSQISVLFSTPSGSEEFAHENSTKAPEGAVTGGVSGATIGGVLGWLAGIGSLAIPGVGPLIAAGPIVAALSGASIGGAIGGLTGSLVGLGIPEYEAKRFESRINDGGMLISVHVNSSEATDRVKEILESTGAEDVSVKSDESGSNRMNEDRASV